MTERSKNLYLIGFMSLLLAVAWMGSEYLDTKAANEALPQELKNNYAKYKKGIQDAQVGDFVHINRKTGTKYKDGSFMVEDGSVTETWVVARKPSNHWIVLEGPGPGSHDKQRTFALTTGFVKQFFVENNSVNFVHGKDEGYASLAACYWIQ